MGTAGGQFALTSRRAPSRGRLGAFFVHLGALDSGPSLAIIHPLGYPLRLTGKKTLIAPRHVIETLDAKGF